MTEKEKMIEGYWIMTSEMLHHDWFGDHFDMEELLSQKGGPQQFIWIIYQYEKTLSFLEMIVDEHSVKAIEDF